MFDGKNYGFRLRFSLKTIHRVFSLWTNIAWTDTETEASFRMLLARLNLKVSPEQAQEDTSPAKIDVTSKSSRGSPLSSLNIQLLLPVASHPCSFWRFTADASWSPGTLGKWMKMARSGFVLLSMLRIPAAGILRSPSATPDPG